MTDKQKIKAKVKDLIRQNELYVSENATDAVRYQKTGAYSVLNEVLYFIDSLQEEPVSEELEKAAKDFSNNFDNVYGSIGEQTRKSFKAGAKWSMNQAKVEIQAQSMALAHGCPKEFITEDLGEYINELSKQFPDVSFAKLSRIAVRVAKWKKEQMMEKAIDVEVKVDAGGYPYIPQMELYDYDKDVPLAKAGDGYKAILIKEE